MRTTPGFLVTTAGLELAAAIVPAQSPTLDTRTYRLPVEGTMPSLAGATAWLNSAPLGASDLRGKVVLVEFGTYTCINWLRTMPYVRAWARKYRDHGLLVITVHTPEFTFEKDLDKVRRNLGKLDIDLPVAVDSNHAIWQGFANRYWPAMFFVDARGRVRHHVFGEGGYEQSERIIQQLLREAGHSLPDHGLASINAGGVEVEADWTNLRSAET